MTIIYGAGLTGCLAGALLRDAQIFERSAEENHFGKHKAVLRFREDAIAHATGIPFKKVRVRKSIFYNNHEYDRVTPRLANMYSQKVSGKISERSINNLDVVDRFVAPPDFHAQLGELCASRIRFGVSMDTWQQDREGKETIISTIPMPELLRLLDKQVPEQAFAHQAISVERWRLPDCDVHQTVYFPGEETPVYRATLTGADLIIEGTRSFIHESERNYIGNSLFLALSGAEFVSGGFQQYGKIVPLPDQVRKELLYEITNQFGIFSLGRFACWRNILLDDVYHDVRRIQQMANMTKYDLMRCV